MSAPAFRSRIPEWGKAFLIAMGLLLVLHIFVLRWVTIQSTSMYATLLPGDLVGVQRWPVWTGLHRGDIVVFRDLVQDDRPMGKRRLLVKRVAAVGGDELELRGGKLYINGAAVAPIAGQTGRWTIRLAEGSDPRGLLADLNLPSDLVPAGHTVFDLPLNAELAKRLEGRSDVLTVMPADHGRRGSSHLFPFSPGNRWTNSSYGPIRVPRAGDTVAVNVQTLALYDRIISRYEHNRMSVSGGSLLINGEETDRYIIQQDYLFVLGDSRDHSADSRYWGFVPADHVVGRAGFVLLNARAWEEDGVQGRRCVGLRKLSILHPCVPASPFSFSRSWPFPAVPPDRTCFANASSSPTRTT